MTASKKKDARLIARLSANDFKTKFAGSYLGIVWAFIQPVITILVYWFVFEKGFKPAAIHNAAGDQVPYVLWLIAGMVFFQRSAERRHESAAGLFLSGQKGRI